MKFDLRGRLAAALFAGTLAALAAPVHAGQPDEQARPVTDPTVTARDVAVSPAQDLNMMREEIPEVLIAAQDDPYSTDGLRRCRDYEGAVRALDAVLGLDYDVAGERDHGLSAGKVAKSVVGSLIPFRGVVREVSGARKQDERLEDAILAGMMRRAFLKGMGLKLGCGYPARPADEATRRRIAALGEHD